MSIDHPHMIESFDKSLKEIPRYVIYKDLEHRWIKANETTLDIFGIEDDWYIGKKDKEIAKKSPLYAQIVEECIAGDRQLLKTKEINRSEVQLELEDGTQHIIEIIKTPIFNDDNQLKGILVLGTDITVRSATFNQLKHTYYWKQTYAQYYHQNNFSLSFSVDLEGNFTYIDDKVYTIMGYKQDELLHTSMFRLLVPIETERSIEYFSKVKIGIPQFFDVSFFHKKGFPLYFILTLVPKLEGDQIVGIYGIAKDQTEKKRIENQLRESRERYKHLINAFPETIAVCSEDEILYINRTGARLLGAKNPKELIGMSILNFFPSEKKEGVSRYFKRILENPDQSSDQKTAKMLRLDGEEIYVDVKSIPVLFRDQPAVQLTIRDITAQKKAEQKLEESEQRYFSLFEHNPYGVYMLDLKGRVIEGNPTTEEITGYSVREILNTNPIETISRKDHNKTINYFKKSTRGESHSFEITIYHKNGNMIELEVKHIPIIIRDNVMGVYCILKDITEKKKTEEILRRSDKLSVVGQLAAGVAHEVRNPLTSLKGFINLIQSGYGNQKEYLEIMLSELNRIELIISELLVLSKPNIVNFQNKQVTQLINHVITLLETQSLIRDIQIITEFELELPEINCEENQLKQVFINILKNAMEAMPEGGNIYISVKKTKDHMIHISFKDEGYGIREEDLSQIIDPFFTTKEQGTGLGLMVSYKIIENHNGCIQINSEVKQGTTVEIFLPIENHV